MNYNGYNYTNPNQTNYGQGTTAQTAGATSAPAGSPTHEVRRYTMTSAPRVERQQTPSKDRTHILCMLYWALGVFTGVDFAMMLVILLA